MSRSRITVRSRCAFILAAVAGFTGCGGDDGTDEVTTPGNDASVAAALSELPGQLGQQDLQIVTGDLQRASDAANLERPTDPADADAVARWLDPLQAQPARTDAAGDAGDAAIFVPFPEAFGHPGDVEELHAALGWSVLDVESFVEHSSPPTRFSVVTGPFDEATLADDLIPTGDGVVSTSESDDLVSDLDEQSAADNLGRPVRLAYDEGRIVSSLTTPVVREWLAGAGDTLADDPDLRTVAEVLDEEDVYAAFLLRPASGTAFGAGDGPITDENLQAIDDMLLPAPFHTVAIGWATDDEGAVMTVVYRHDGDDDAAANADALPTILDDGRSTVTGRELQDLYELVDVEHDGALVVATLRPGGSGNPRTIYEAVHQRDTPFLHR